MKNQNNQEKDDFLIIPNPIYDVVFRYLMQDYDSALIILSTLIGEKIIKLDFQPLTHAKKKTTDENTTQTEALINKRFDKKKKKILADNSLSKIEKDIKIEEIVIKDPTTEKDIKLVHLDFMAIIELETGEQEMVMIELQKVENESDIFRFREYIAENLIKKRKVEITDTDTGLTKKIEVHYRLIPIFILNFTIENEIKDLMLKTKQLKTGIFTNKNFDANNNFIQELTYEIYVAQLPYLNQIDSSDYENDKYKSKLYALLKIFDQQAITKDNEHRLRLAKKIFPKSLNRILKRLASADKDNPDLEKQMRAEDAYLNALKERDNKISYFKLKFKETAKELDNEKKISKEKDKALGEKDKALGEKDKALGEHQKIIFQFAKTLKNNGETTEKIQEQTNLSREDIEKL